MRGFTMDFGSYNRSAYGISSTRIVVSVTFLAVGVNTFPKYDSHYHDCHDNFNIFVKKILTKKPQFVKPEISLSAEAHYFFCFPEELFFGKVIFTKTAKYSTSLNDISKKKKRYLKNSKKILKDKSGTFRYRNKFLEKN